MYIQDSINFALYLHLKDYFCFILHCISFFFFILFHQLIYICGQVIAILHIDSICFLTIDHYWSLYWDIPADTLLLFCTVPHLFFDSLLICTLIYLLLVLLSILFGYTYMVLYVGIFLPLLCLAYFVALFLYYLQFFGVLWYTSRFCCINYTIYHLPLVIHFTHSSARDTYTFRGGHYYVTHGISYCTGWHQTAPYCISRHALHCAIYIFRLTLHIKVRIALHSALHI